MAKRVPLKDYDVMFKELKEGTDRSVAILGAAYVEEVLLDAILAKLDIADERVIEELLGNGAPLGTFSNKIMFANAISVIGDKTRRELDRIRKIRNTCAHDVNAVSFSQPPMKDQAAALRPRRYPGLPNHEPWLPEEPRARFVECCSQISLLKLDALT